MVAAAPRRRRGDIRNWHKAIESRCNWGWLDGCFAGTWISPTDIDFWVERNGHFLVGEIKPVSGRPEVGQEITLRQLSRLPQFTTFTLTGAIKDHEITPETIFIFGRDIAPRAIDRQGFRLFVSAWFNNAERSPIMRDRR